ncbi:MAG TPA: four helix bundle suffix domain-containing protein [Bacteroidales bacterium]|nr:four helix bundle suffix domain-containing protein [Bacteroidales bacterium]
MKTNQNSGFIPPHGGYEKLISYQKAEIIYDGTLHFIDRFISKRDRTYDQMKQAARSGKQNIAEGSMASGTSKQTEITLTNVARASLEELILDYKDFIRKQKLELWDKNHRLTKRFRELNKTPNANYETYKKAIENPDPEICANSLICLIYITCYLLDKQIAALERAFLKEGGIRERMTKARLDARNEENS